jgi:hypothetical protein
VEVNATSEALRKDTATTSKFKARPIAKVLAAQQALYMLNQQAVSETWTDKMQQAKAWDAPGAAHL